MMTYSIHERGGLPREMQTLLRDYPRDTWPDHPNFAASIRKWMGAHALFRGLARRMGDDTQAFLGGDMEQQDYTDRLAHYGTRLVQNLHGHHHWEDRKFFPELSGADPRFDRGLDMLETDHQEMDQLLDRFSRGGNRMIQLASLDPAQVPEEARHTHDRIAGLQGFLDRHLTDEEDLTVPILLHHAMRG